jgi:hypothetical protein
MVACLVGLAVAGELEQARAFVKIGDYANAVVALHKLTLREPTNVTARRLLARAFVECSLDLHLADIRVGKDNRERAAYQLEILTRLGEEGRDALIACITEGDGKLAPLAVEIAGKKRVTEAVDAIIAFGHNEKPIEKFVSKPVSAEALAQIGGPKAVAALKAMLLAGPHPQFRAGVIEAYVDAVNAEGLLQLALESKAKDVLAAVVKGTSHPAPVYAAVAGRKDVELKTRATAFSRLAASKEWPAKKRAEVIVAAMKDDLAATKLRPHAINVLRKLDPAQAAELVVAQLEDPESGPVQPEHFKLLAAAGGQGLTELLLRILEEKVDREKSTRWAALDRGLVWQTLGRRGVKGHQLVRAAKLMVMPEPSTDGRRVRPQPLSSWIPYRSGLNKKAQATLIALLLKDEDASIRLQALYAVRALPPAVGVKHVRAATKDDDEKVRKLAQGMMMDYAGEGLLKPDELAPIIESQASYRISPMLKNLARKKRKADADIFLKALERKDATSYNIVAPAALYFAAVPDPRAAKPLTALLTGKNRLHSSNSTQVAKAIKVCMKDRAALLKELVAGVEEGPDTTRRSCVAALRVLGDKSVVSALAKAAKETKSYHLRQEIQAAIAELLTREEK